MMGIMKGSTNIVGMLKNPVTFFMLQEVYPIAVGEFTCTKISSPQKKEK